MILSLLLVGVSQAQQDGRMRVQPPILAPQQVQQNPTAQGGESGQPAAQASPSGPNYLPLPKSAPKKAQISLDGKGLMVVADNSSLLEIFNELGTIGGLKVEGLVRDERIYGTYGPGAPTEVLVKLLQGTGYNVVMRGLTEWKIPKVVVLTSRNPEDAKKKPLNQPSMANNTDDDIAGVDNTPPDDGSGTMPKPNGDPNQPPPR